MPQWEAFVSQLVDMGATDGGGALPSVLVGESPMHPLGGQSVGPEGLHIPNCSDRPSLINE